MILERNDLGGVGATAGGGGGGGEALGVDSGNHRAIPESRVEVQAAGVKDHSEFFFYIEGRLIIFLIILFQSALVVHWC